MASVDENNLRFFRTLLILIKEGKNVLIYVLRHRTFKSGDLEQYLNNNKPILEKLKQKKIISQHQWEKLFSTKPDVDTWDVGLIILLLQNISGVDMSSKDELSLGENLRNIREMRNEIQGHIPDPSISEEYFNEIYNKLSSCLRNIVNSVPDSENFAREVDESIHAYKGVSLDPVLYQSMKEQMRQWNAMHIDLNEMYAFLSNKMDENQSVLKKINTNQSENMNTILDGFEKLTKEFAKFKDRVQIKDQEVQTDVTNDSDKGNISEHNDLITKEMPVDQDWGLKEEDDTEIRIKTACTKSETYFVKDYNKPNSVEDTEDNNAKRCPDVQVQDQTVLENEFIHSRAEINDSNTEIDTLCVELKESNTTEIDKSCNIENDIGICKSLEEILVANRLNISEAQNHTPELEQSLRNAESQTETYLSTKFTQTEQTFTQWPQSWMLTNNHQNTKFEKLNMARLSCGHTYKIDALNSLVMYQIHDEQACLKCMKPNCSKVLNISEIKGILKWSSQEMEAVRSKLMSNQKNNKRSTTTRLPPTTIKLKSAVYATRIRYNVLD